MPRTNPSTGFAVLRSVVEQILDDLNQSNRVAIENETLLWQVQEKFLVLAVDTGANRCDRLLNQLGQFRGASPKLYFSTHDSRNIHQIVHESHNVAPLRLHELNGVSMLAILRCQKVEPAADRSKWVPKLVGEHGRSIVIIPGSAMLPASYKHLTIAPGQEL